MGPLRHGQGDPRPGRQSVRRIHLRDGGVFPVPRRASVVLLRGHELHLEGLADWGHQERAQLLQGESMPSELPVEFLSSPGENHRNWVHHMIFVLMWLIGADWGLIVEGDVIPDDNWHFEV